MVPRGRASSLAELRDSGNKLTAKRIHEAAEAGDPLALGIVLLCHRRWSSARAGVEIDHYLDVMELFAFVRPARFALPTPAGLAQQLGLARPQNGEDMATLLPQIAFTLLDELANAPDAARQEAGQIATMMTSGGWNWGPYILLHLGLPQPAASSPRPPAHPGRCPGSWSAPGSGAAADNSPQTTPCWYSAPPAVPAARRCNWRKQRALG